ncbi:MAG: hypothetical protein LBR07_08685 [Puniceicoccales bacterium]|jgi:hypothetical protein|nr:hypothetical protein [Puniceicoccales bacterium]
MRTRLIPRLFTRATNSDQFLGLCLLVGWIALGAIWFVQCWWQQNRVVATGGAAFFGCMDVLLCPQLRRILENPARRRAAEDIATVLLALAFFGTVIVSANIGGEGRGIHVDEAPRFAILFPR